MDVELYKGEILGRELSFGLLKSKNVLCFEKDGKYLFPRDKEKKLIKIPEEINVKKIKKDSEESLKAIEYYLERYDLDQTTFGAHLFDLYHKLYSKGESIIEEELDEEGKAFFSKIYKIFMKRDYIRKASFVKEYWKEAFVISNFCWLDLELFINTFAKDFDEVLLKDKKPIAVYSLRYSTRKVQEEDLNKIGEVVSEQLKKWLKWREIWKADQYTYNYLIHWLFSLLNKYFPLDEETIKELTDKAEQMEIISKREFFLALQQGQDFEAENLKQVTLNSMLLYYLAYQFLVSEKELRIKEYNSVLTNGYHDIFIYLANSFSSIPLFTALNPPNDFSSAILFEWITKNFDFSEIQSKLQLDPYQFTPNVLGLTLAIVSKNGKNLQERKYLLAKFVEKLLTKERIKTTLRNEKSYQLRMQNKEPKEDEIEVSEKEVEDELKKLKEIITNILNGIEVEKDRKAELDKIFEEFNIIEDDYDKISKEKSKYITIEDEKLKKELNEFQKDFILSIQTVEQDKKVIEKLAQLFKLFNTILEAGKGSSEVINGACTTAWLISLINGGEINWITKNEIDSEQLLPEESMILSRMNFVYNTPLVGYYHAEYPITEVTAPTLAVHSSKNLRTMLILKDYSTKEMPLYELILENVKGLYI